MLHFPSKMDRDPGGGSGRSTQASGTLNFEGALKKPPAASCTQKPGEGQDGGLGAEK